MSHAFKTPHSLKGDELFFFLRSFLIVMFSCLKQSLKLSAEAVGRCISNTAQMVMDDVMSYQWQNRKKDRVDFDEFGEWYNEGGFEAAPWLEILDLNKWVLLDDKKQKLINQTYELKPHHVIKKDRNDPLLPLDTNDYSKDEEKGEDQECIKLHGDQGNQKLDSNLSSPSEIKSLSTEVKALQFNLQLNDDREGCVISISPQRVNILKQLVTEYDLMHIDLTGASEKIISEANGKMLKNDKFFEKEQIETTKKACIELIKKFKGNEDNIAYLVLLHFEEVVYILNDSSSTLLLCLVGSFLGMWLGVSIITTGDN